MGVPISNVTRRVVYTASGTGPYNFTFEILAAGDVAVYRDDTLLTLTTDYTVTINANGTGFITLVAAPTGATQIAIVGNRTIQRTTDFVTGGDFFANTVNDEMDQQTIFAQQNAEGLQRALQAPQTDPTSINMTLPRASVRAGKYLSFDNDGNPVAVQSKVELDAVYAIRDDIVAVSAIDDQVVAVAGNATNVNTVAGISSNVTTVAGVAANVTTVAGISSNVTSVAGNATNINTVAGSIANVNAVGPSISNVNAVAGNSTNINTVAGQISPTNNVGAVAAVASSVPTVAGIASNVTTVAGISSNVTTVAGISADVTAVAGNNANVSSVASNISSVNTAALNIGSIINNATNITAIQNASANATSAAASAATATTQATNAAASAAAASAVVLGNEPVRPLIRPSLLLDFANTKQLDPRITFTRASTGTFYDGRTVAKAEENLVTFSEQFDNAAWGKIGATVTANAVAAPDGTTTADTLTGDGTATRHVVSQNFSGGAATYVISVYARAGTNNFIQVLCGGANTQFANFDIGTGATGTVGASVSGSSITAVGGGWYRCVMTLVAAVAPASMLVLLASTSSDAYYPVNSLATTVHLWGAQVEQRSSVTAYTATTTAPITNYIPALQTAAAGVPRFEHNPVTGVSLGLEIEEQRANLVTYSEQFNDAAWTKVAATISANAIVAPDGTLTGDKLVADTTSSSSHSVTSLSSALTGIHTLSVYAKKGEYSFLELGERNTTGNRAVFNLDTGVVATSVLSPDARIVSVGNGWYRCSISATLAAQGFGVRISANSTSASSAAYAGDGWSGIYIWGAQLEAGAFATSYIPTVASQVTRSADSAVMTGTNFSSWYRADEGTFYASVSMYGRRTGFESIAAAHVSTTNNGILLGTQGPSGGARNYVITNGSVVADLQSGTFSLNTEFKTALAYRANDFASSFNAGTVQTDTSGALAAGVDRLTIGNEPTVSPFGGIIRKIAYYPARVTNAQLQAMTTV